MNTVVKSRIRRVFNMIFFLVLCQTLTLSAAEDAISSGNLLSNGDFETGTSSWKMVSPPLIRADTAGVQPDINAHSGKQAARLKSTISAVAIEQTTPQLQAGVHEFTVWVSGKGRLSLAVRQVASRNFTIAEDGWHQYSLVFDLKEPRTCVVACELLRPGSEALVDDTALALGDDALKTAWKNQQDAQLQFGYIPSGYSAQRPEPITASIPRSVERAPVAITRKVILFDPCYDTAWMVNPDKIAAWFSARGFEVQTAKELESWMQERVAKHDSYGSVVVSTMGLVLKKLVTPDDETCLLYRYLDDGGRFVWMGDLVLNYMEDDSGPMQGGPGSQKLLGVACSTKFGDSAPMVSSVGKAWGLKNPGNCSRAAPTESVTLSLAGNETDGCSSIWLKTVNAAYPLSGFIAGVRVMDGKNTGDMEDFFRLALYDGKTVEIPQVTVAPDKQVAFEASISTTSGAIPRRAFVRGETPLIRTTLSAPPEVSGKAEVNLRIFEKAPEIKAYDLAQDGVKKYAEEINRYHSKLFGMKPIFETKIYAAISNGSAVCEPISLDIDLKVGDYMIEARVAQVSGAAFETRVPLAICAPRKFDRFKRYIRRGGGSPVKFRMYDVIEELRDLGLDSDIGVDATVGSTSSIDQDAMLRAGMDFMLNADAWIVDSLVENRKNAKMEDIPNPWGGGKKGLPGLAGQECRERVFKACSQASVYTNYPNFSRMFECNDDFSARAGWDYNEKNRIEFKTKTGLEAPIPKELMDGTLNAEKIARTPGIIPDNDPWLLWNQFLVRDVHGGFNDAIRRGLLAGCPGARVFEVTGSAIWVNFEVRAGQYPPLMYGADFGLNASGYYVYYDYWAPSLQYIYHTEINRMGNREIPCWAMPDVSLHYDGVYNIRWPDNCRHYIRNQFHLLMAGGGKGISYFNHAWLPRDWTNARAEHRDLASLVQKYGALLHRINPSRKNVGLLVPFSEAIFSTPYPQGMPFGSMLMAHIDVEPVAEEEISDAPYKVIVLCNVKHLKQSTVKALETYVNCGGVVLCDKDCKVPITGAKRLDSSFARAIDPFANGKATATLYGDTRLISQLTDMISPYAAKEFDSPEETTIIRKFTASDGAVFAYVVNIDNQEEYAFWFNNIYKPLRMSTEFPLPREKMDEFVREHGMGNTIKDTVMTVLFDQKFLPTGGQVVDIYAGQVLTPTAADGGKLMVKVTTRKFGGTVLAFLPKIIDAVEIIGGDKVRRGEYLDFRISVVDASKKSLTGVQPLEVTLKQPDGTIEHEVTGYEATDAGVYKMSFKAAMNHPAGTWTLKAKELMTGKCASFSFEVK